MNASSCIYMYCNIERNIMKNQSGSLGLLDPGGTLCVFVFCSHHCLFFYLKNSFAGNFCTRLKPTSVLFGKKICFNSNSTKSIK